MEAMREGTSWTMSNQEIIPLSMDKKIAFSNTSVTLESVDI